jgi:hypothetical protein
MLIFLIRIWLLQVYLLRIYGMSSRDMRVRFNLRFIWPIPHPYTHLRVALSDIALYPSSVLAEQALTIAVGKTNQTFVGQLVQDVVKGMSNTMCHALSPTHCPNL